MLALRRPSNAEPSSCVIDRNVSDPRDEPEVQDGVEHNDTSHEEREYLDTSREEREYLDSSREELESQFSRSTQFDRAQRRIWQVWRSAT